MVMVLTYLALANALYGVEKRTEISKRLDDIVGAFNAIFFVLLIVCVTVLISRLRRVRDLVINEEFME